MANKSVFTRMSETLFGKTEQTTREEKGTNNMKIGIISGSVREGRNSAAVTEMTKVSSMKWLL